jgi:hypothetical protein
MEKPKATTDEGQEDAHMSDNVDHDVGGENAEFAGFDD